MSAFLAAVEARRLADREAQVLATPGRDLKDEFPRPSLLAPPGAAGAQLGPTGRPRGRPRGDGRVLRALRALGGRATRAQLFEALGGKSVGNAAVHRAARRGLLRRVRPGVYEVAP